MARQNDRRDDHVEHVEQEERIDRTAGEEQDGRQSQQVDLNLHDGQDEPASLASAVDAPNCKRVDAIAAQQQRGDGDHQQDSHLGTPLVSLIEDL